MAQGGNPPNAPRERVRGYLPHRHLFGQFGGCCVCNWPVSVLAAIVSLALKRVPHRANLCTFDVLLLTASADILGEYYSTSTPLWGEICLVEGLE